VTGTCASGSSIRAIGADGNVTCETDDGITVETDPKVGSNTLNYVPKWDGSALVKGTIYDSGGNIGITTTTPVSKLDVNGDVNVNSSSVYKIGGNTVLSTKGTENIFLGFDAGKSNTTGIRNTFLGRSAGSSNTTASWNTFLGYSAGSSNTGGIYNTFLGSFVGYSNSTGRDNTFLGSFAGYSNTTGGANTFLGNSAGRSNTTGELNTFLGYGAGYANTTGNLNTFLGYAAGNCNTTGYDNTFLGNSAGRSNTTGNSNTFLGNSAGNSNTAGIYNTFLGYYAGYANTTGNLNTFSGYYAGHANTTGYLNTFLGNSAGYANTTGYLNTFLGMNAGYHNTTGYGNVFIGFSAGHFETGSNKLYIDNSDTSSPLIKGDFSANSVTINGSFNVAGTKSFIQPHAKDPTKEIVYIATEAPEAMVMYRGAGQLKEGVAVIELPEHFRVVVAENGIQVQVTPTEDCNGIFVGKKSREQIEVKELMKGKSNAKFDYLVNAVRAGFEKHEPVVANTNFRPKENEKAKDFEARYVGEDINTKAMRAMLISNGILTRDGELNMEVVKNLGWIVKEADVANVSQ
jgi:hypothetical protein